MTAFNEKQHIEIREAPEAAQQALIASGVQPIIARVFAARGIQTHSELDASLSNLIPFQSLKNCKKASTLYPCSGSCSLLFNFALSCNSDK